MNRFAPILTLLLVVGLGSGCVTRELRVMSDPQGAKVFHDGTYVGNAPVTFEMTFNREKEDHWTTHHLSLELEDYEPKNEDITLHKLPQEAHVNPLEYKLERLRHALSVAVRSTPSAAQLLVNGEVMEDKTDATLTLEFTRSSSRHGWSTHMVGGRLAVARIQRT